LTFKKKTEITKELESAELEEERRSNFFLSREHREHDFNLKKVVSKEAK